MYKRVKVIISGVFTVPANGAWRVNYNLWSAYGGKDQNVLRLIYQGTEVVEMIYRSVAWTGAYKDRYVFSTGGREAFFHAEPEETFFLYASEIDVGVGPRGLFDILICFEYLN